MDDTQAPTSNRIAPVWVLTQESCITAHLVQPSISCTPSNLQPRITCRCQWQWVVASIRCRPDEFPVSMSLSPPFPTLQLAKISQRKGNSAQIKRTKNIFIYNIKDFPIGTRIQRTGPVNTVGDWTGTAYWKAIWQFICTKPFKCSYPRPWDSLLVKAFAM